MHNSETALIDLFHISDDFTIEIENQIILLHRSLRSEQSDMAEQLQQQLDTELRPMAEKLISKMASQTENASWMDRKIARSLIRDMTHQLKSLEWALAQQKNQAA